MLTQYFRSGRGYDNRLTAQEVTRFEKILIGMDDKEHVGFQIGCIIETHVPR